MPDPGPSQRIEQARALIARHRCAEARALLAPLRGIPAIAGPVEMLVGYSFVVEVDHPQAVKALKLVPAGAAASIVLAVGRLLLACESGPAALDRFRRVLVEHPASGDAAVGAADAFLICGHPETALVWCDRAARSTITDAPGFAATRLMTLADLDRLEEAAAIAAQELRSGNDVDMLLAVIFRRILKADGRTGSVGRLAAIIAPEIRRMPKTATAIASAEFLSADLDDAEATLAAAGGGDQSALPLRHQIALERNDTLTAAAVVNLARRRVIEQPQAAEPALDLLCCLLRTLDHDSALLLRWAARCSCAIGSGLKPGPDMLFSECVRWKNDMTQRQSRLGLKLSHVLGALSAERTFKSPVAARNGATHASIEIAGRKLRLRLTSNQVRSATDVQFALEPGMLRWFAGFTPSDVLVDIGANVGMFSVLAAGISGCRVVAIEPFSVNVADLEHNVAANGLQDRVTVLHAAASDRERMDTLYFGQTYAGAANQSFGQDDISEQYDDRDAQHETVRGVPIDTLVAQGEIPFPTHVKIDVDGLEEPVIEGMRGVLADPRFKSLRMEIRWQDEAKSALVDSILAHGFSVRVADDVKNLLFERLPGR